MQAVYTSTVTRNKETNLQKKKKKEINHPTTQVEKTVSVLFIGNSQINHLDKNKMSSRMTVSKMTAYTVEQATELMASVEKAHEHIVFHLITNDIKEKEPDVVTTELYLFP